MQMCIRDRFEGCWKEFRRRRMRDKAMETDLRMKSFVFAFALCSMAEAAFWFIGLEWGTLLSQLAIRLIYGALIDVYKRQRRIRENNRNPAAISKPATIKAKSPSASAEVELEVWEKRSSAGSEGTVIEVDGSA